MFVGDKYKYIHTGVDLRLNRIRLAWHITDWCNYNCPYCIQTVNHHYASQPKESQEDVEKVANLLRPKFHNQNVTLTLYGGEVSTFYDLSSICNILFKDNNCDAVVTLLTNLSAPYEKYKSFLNLNIPNVRVRIIPSYQWSNVDVFLDKCKKIILYLDKKFQVTCVVYDGHSLEQVKNVAQKFKEAKIPLRFTFARVPKSNNQFYKLQDGVEDFIKDWNKNYFDKKTCKVIYTDGTECEKQCRSDVLKEVSEYEGLTGASFKDMTCITGLNLTPSGNIRAGSCPDRKDIILGNILTDDISLKPYRAKCEGKGFCNLCNSVVIWNGKF